MIFQEASWIRLNTDKFCPILKKQALEWYRPLKYMPCFIQKLYKSIKQRFKKVPIIVQLDEDLEYSTCLQHLSITTSCKVAQELPLIHGFCANVNAKVLEQLITQKKVKKIWFDDTVKAVLDIASKEVNASALWNSNPSYTGKGIVAAVLDTGIYNHPDLSGRIIAFKDFINKRTKTYDDNGHGTHVAGDLASNGSKSKGVYKGAAPEASLIGVKVLDRYGSGTLSKVIQGIQWCISNKDALNIRIISLSLGSTASAPHTNDPLCQAVEKAWDAGIIVCAAAGNEGPDAYSISSPGIDPKIITVGALDDKSTSNALDDDMAYFSSRGPTLEQLLKPDVVAPGVNIVSLRSPSSILDKQYSSYRVGSYYFSLSGTSMATPICSGVTALLLQKNPKLTPSQIKALLMNTAHSIDSLPATTQGSGLIDAIKAIEKI